MLIIGCDFHTRYQQIATVDTATGELVERRLDHESGEAHAFYRSLPKPVRVGGNGDRRRERGQTGSFPNSENLQSRLLEQISENLPSVPEFPAETN